MTRPTCQRRCRPHAPPGSRGPALLFILLSLGVLLSACTDTSTTGSESTPALVMLTPATTSTPLPTITPNATEIAQAMLSGTDTSADVTAEPTCTPGHAIMHGLAVGYDGIPGITWVATSIVHGTVIRELPAARQPAQPLATGDAQLDERNRCDAAQIYTDYVVRVDATYRGSATADGTIVVRRQGGTVGEVTLINEGDPELQIGLEAVFFLHQGHPLYPDALVIAAGTQGLVRINDGTVLTPLPPSNLAGRPLSTLATLIADTLRRSDPADYLDAVPLDIAPAGPDLPS